MSAPVQHAYVRSVGAVASISLAFGSNLTAGNMILAGCMSNAVADIVAANVTDTLSHTYVLDVHSRNTGPNRTAAWCRVSGVTAGACTVTLDVSGSAHHVLALSEWAGMDPVPLSGTGTANFSSSTAPATGSFSPSGACTVLGLMSWAGDRTSGQGATYTALDKNDVQAVDSLPFNAEYKTVAGGTYTADWTLDSAADGAAVAAAYLDVPGQTRFYLPSSGTAVVSPPFTHQASWTQTGAADRLMLSRTKRETALTSLAQASTIIAGQTQLVRQYVSDPLMAQTIAAGTVKGTIRVLESSALGNLDNIAVKIVVTSADGSTLTGAILNLSTYIAVNEWATSLTNRRVADGDTTLAVTVNNGDRLVIELGYSTSTLGASISGSMNFGDDAASDCADDETGTAANNPFVELSVNVKFLMDATVPAAQFTASSGMIGRMTV